MTAIDRANLLAGQAVAYATAYLDGRHEAAWLARNVEQLHLDLFGVGLDASTRAILDPVRLLATAMTHTALTAAGGTDANLPFQNARLERWQSVMAALVELVRHESRELSR
jgi:hypothetical protein